LIGSAAAVTARASVITTAQVRRARENFGIGAP
jgi:hypothetical protein